MPSASVTARNVETGLKGTVTSNLDGNYRIEILPVGFSGIRHGATMLDEEGVLIDIFSPIREDFL